MNWRLECSPYHTWPPSCPQPGATQTDQEAWPAGAPLLAAQSELHVQKTKHKYTCISDSTHILKECTIVGFSNVPPKTKPMIYDACG